MALGSAPASRALATACSSPCAVASTRAWASGSTGVFIDEHDTALAEGACATGSSPSCVAGCIASEPLPSPSPRPPTTVADYVAACEDALGPIPALDCTAYPEIPVTVDGVPIWDDEDLADCDRPAAFGAPCQVGNRLGRDVGRYPDGAPRPSVAWVTYCRGEGVAVIGSTWGGFRCPRRSPTSSAHPR